LKPETCNAVIIRDYALPPTIFASHAAAADAADRQRRVALFQTPMVQQPPSKEISSQHRHPAHEENNTILCAES